MKPLSLPALTTSNLFLLASELSRRYPTKIDFLASSSRERGLEADILPLAIAQHLQLMAH